MGDSWVELVVGGVIIGRVIVKRKLAHLVGWILPASCAAQVAWRWGWEC